MPRSIKSTKKNNSDECNNTNVAMCTKYKDDTITERCNKCHNVKDKLDFGTKKNGEVSKTCVNCLIKMSCKHGRIKSNCKRCKEDNINNFTKYMDNYEFDNCVECVRFKKQQEDNKCTQCRGNHLPDAYYVHIIVDHLHMNQPLTNAPTPAPTPAPTTVLAPTPINQPIINENNENTTDPWTEEWRKMDFIPKIQNMTISINPSKKI